MFEELKMKKCKECGKLFLPKSSRSQYCDSDHFRPCPICGVLVIAKYLSDPPRRCDKCKSVRENKHICKSDDIEVELQEDAGTGDFSQGSLNKSITAKYVGSSVCGWHCGHIYDLHIIRNPYGYTVIADNNQTNPDEDVSRVQLPLTSFISVNQNFRREELG